MSRQILPIVEGQSEVESVPILLRRILDQMKIFSIQIAKPWRVKRNKVVKEGELERAIQQGIQERNNICAILVLLDADDDCPAELGPQLLKRCKTVTQLPASVILANKEMESWFLGGKESLRGVRGIKGDATAPLTPESIRGASERLSQNMEKGRRYVGPDDQPALVKYIDFLVTRQRCPSFEKFLRDVEYLIKSLVP